MKLFIRIVDGQPDGHPIMEDNFRAAFPDIDINNLPDGFAEFERIEPPAYGVFEKCSDTYTLVDGKWKDVYTVTDMSEEEKSQTIADARAVPHPDLWVFSETDLTWSPGNLDTDSSEPEVV